MKVENITNNQGNDIPNQFIIRTKKGRYFQSYKSIIAFIPNDNTSIQLGKNWEYSTTTGKYRNMFLGEDKKETTKKLDTGVYILNNSLENIE